MNAIDRLAGLDRMSALDAAFLALESPATPMHIGSLTYLDPGPLRDADGRVRLDALRSLVDRRLALAPRFRQRPLEAPLGLGRPVWAGDPDFDVANHVNEIVLPAPGSERQLRDLCAQLMMKKLDRSRPLWELWVVDGLETGEIVLIEKVHHVMLDGVAGVDMVVLLTDPTERVEDPGAAGRPAMPRPATPTLVAADLVEALALPFSTAVRSTRAGGRALRAALDRSERDRLIAGLAELGRGAASLLGAATAAPPSPLNRRVGRHRIYDHVEVQLDTMRHIARRFECTVNDVALTAVAAAVRQLFVARDEGVGAPFQVAVPVSVRVPGDRAVLGNRLAVFLVPLPVGISDERAQLEAVRRSTRRAKAAGQAAATARLVEAADWLPMPVVSFVARLAHHQPFANAVVTNIPGPPEPRFLLGARIRRIAPIVPLAENLDVSVGLFSYCGEVCFGCLADAERCPDVGLFTEAIRAAIETLAGYDTELAEVAT
jgi:diacylglycerol O-acyltransferase / wax synthase